MKTLVTIGLLCALAPMKVAAQNLISEYELDYVYKYSTYELEDVDPDSVFGFYEYGSVYSPEDFTDDDEQLTTDLLKCRNLQVLELHNIAASEVVSQLDKFPYLQLLILDNVGMASIPDGIYTLNHLVKLNLGSFTAFYLDPERIHGENVKYLELADNTLACPDGSDCDYPLASFPNLEVLSLSGSFPYLPASLYDCTGLTELNIADCELEEIDGDIGNLESLETLNIARNYYLTDVPDEVEYLENLTYLDISGTGLETLPYGFTNCLALESIDASYSSISEIPETIGNLKNLYSLNLSGCSSLSDLPAELKDCEYLSNLNVYGCGFYAIPRVIGNMQSLVDLDISYNYISVIPSYLSGAKNLSTLDLSGNNLNKFEVGSCNLPALYKIRLNSCGLNTLSPELFKLTNLETIDLSYDSLTEIPVGFYALTKLSSIYLGNNFLKTLPKGISKLTALNDLNLEMNQITALPKDLAACTTMSFLNFPDNKVKKFPKGMSKLKNLMYLDARGNKGIVFKKEFAALSESIYEIQLRPDDISADALTKLKTWIGESKVYLNEY